MSTVRDTPAAAGPVVPLLRRAAAALRGTPDRRALAASLNEFMQLVPALHAAWIELPVEEGRGETAADEVPFSPAALTLPLRTGSMVTGALRQRLDGPPLDADRLHMLGAVAELLGAILEQAAQAAAARQARALLDVMIEHMPFGVACFSPAGDVLAANAAVRGFSGGREGLASLLLPANATPSPGEVARAVHVARAGERVALVQLHGGGGATTGAGTVALVFDLGRQSREFLDVVARETYRALWLHQPLSLAVLSAPATAAAALHRLADTIRERLALVTAVVGPLEADTMAVLAPGTSIAMLRTLIRSVTGLADIPQLQLGLAELEPAHRSPENFITAAVSALAPLERWRRPTLLLCDTSPSVTEALHVALRTECDAVRCHDRELGWRLLGERAFDAIFAKIELDEWDRDLGFLVHALELQPGMRPFVMTDAPGLYSATLSTLPAGTPVFRKPFQVSAVRNAVREQLARRETAA